MLSLRRTLRSANGKLRAVTDRLTTTKIEQLAEAVVANDWNTQSISEETADIPDWRTERDFDTWSTPPGWLMDVDIPDGLFTELRDCRMASKVFAMSHEDTCRGHRHRGSRNLPCRGLF
mmetsp:Transcript_4008/g.11424  ORF Transcript_4008/g.11424 Transcript_4008/m.11424 type:complete len:119 (+) Transcript_4008:33-389(+)